LALRIAADDAAANPDGAQDIDVRDPPPVGHKPFASSQN